jgi:hypothetical protein
MPKKARTVAMPPIHELIQGWDDLLEEEGLMAITEGKTVEKQISEPTPAKQKLRSGLPNYRKQALKAYPHICVYCGFGIAGVLEVAHLDCNPQNCDLTNLALLCPTCHRMHDLNLIPTEIIRNMRDTERKITWQKLMKDAAAKAVATKKNTPSALKEAAKKAHKTRQERKAQEMNSK